MKWIKCAFGFHYSGTSYGFWTENSETGFYTDRTNNYSCSWAKCDHCGTKYILSVSPWWRKAEALRRINK